MAPAPSGTKLSSDAEGEDGYPGSSGVSEVELAAGGGGGGSGALELGGSVSLPSRRGGGGEHQVLLLGLREGSLVDDDLLLHPSPRGSWPPRPVRMRSRGPSPTAAELDAGSPHGS